MAVLAINKKASFDYEFLETYDAGIVLFGHEVKSVRSGQVNLKGAYISFKPDESRKIAAYLVNCHISLYKFAGKMDAYQPERDRKILLKKKELDHLFSKKQEKGLTVIPVKLYTKGSFIKLELAVGRGKKKYDKRDDLKKKDEDRRIKTLLKSKLKISL